MNSSAISVSAFRSFKHRPECQIVLTNLLDDDKDGCVRLDEFRGYISTGLASANKKCKREGKYGRQNRKERVFRAL